MILLTLQPLVAWDFLSIGLLLGRALIVSSTADSSRCTSVRGGRSQLDCCSGGNESVCKLLAGIARIETSDFTDYKINTFFSS